MKAFRIQIKGTYPGNSQAVPKVQKISVEKEGKEVPLVFRQQKTNVGLGEFQIVLHSPTADTVQAVGKDPISWFKKVNLVHTLIIRPEKGNMNQIIIKEVSVIFPFGKIPAITIVQK